MEITIDDVAKASGYSRTTVSRAFAESSKVNALTKDTIYKVAKDLNYKPRNSRIVISTNEKIIALVVGDITNPFYNYLTKATAEYLRKEGYMLVLCDSAYDEELEDMYLKMVKRKYFNGIIMSYTSGSAALVNKLKSIECPVVLINRSFPSVNTDVVSVDNFKGGYLATKYLIKHGHRKIGHIKGLGTSKAAADRTQGYLEALKDANIEVNDKYIFESDFRMDTGYEIGKRILNSALDLTAIFCVSDVVAAGLINYFLEHNVAVPEKISVMGFDDSRAAVEGKIKISTVRTPAEILGYRAAKMLIKRINDSDEPCQRLLIEPQLIIRESTAAISGKK